MTNEQYTAKNWLMLLRDYEDKLKAEKRTLELLQERLYRGVEKYGGDTGRRDPITARAAHEDNLLDFTGQIERVTKAENEYLAELQLRHEVIEAIPAKLQPIAIDRYINNIKWEDLADIYNYSRANIFEINHKILTHVAQILNAKKTPLTITPNKRTQEAAAV